MLGALPGVNMLPPELRKNLRLMRELDAQSQGTQLWQWEDTGAGDVIHALATYLGVAGIIITMRDRIAPAKCLGACFLRLI